jgi:hypothetical protein
VFGSFCLLQTSFHAQIYATMALTRAAAVMSAYYGLASASMSDMVRDIVYGDTTESWFSPAGWYRDGKYGREIHPGSTGHQTMTYALAYNLLNLVSTRCNMVEYEVAPGSQVFRQTVTEQLPYNYSAERQPALLGGKARPTPRYSLPPRLTKSLALHNVSQLWQEDEYNTTQVLEASRGVGVGTGATTTQCYSARCPFAWVQGTAEEFFKLPPGLEGYFEPVTKEMTNWTLEKGKKSGFVPAYGTDPADNRLVWEFESLKQPIRSVTLFFMKSYGEKWDNSVVRMDVYKNPVSEPSAEGSSSLVKLSKGRRQRRRLQALRRPQNVTHTNVTTTTTMAMTKSEISRRKLELSSSSLILISKELEGFHAKKTSETYSETVEFPTSLSVGDTLRLQFTLLRGNSFKIMGIIVCS